VGVAEALRRDLPPIYGDSSHHHQFFQAVGDELDALRLALAEAMAAAKPLDPRFPSWAIPQWEQDLGLPVAPAASDAERVNRIRARLRGFGTATRAKVVRVANSFENGQVIVLEDYARYRVTLKFASLRGVPPYLEQVIAAVEEILPAHLELAYELVYTTFRMVTEEADTFAGLSARGLTFADLSTYL
jgi:hypothetical protein